MDIDPREVCRPGGRLVLTPIERMISKLDKIRNNPLEAMTIGRAQGPRQPRSKALSARKMHQKSLIQCSRLSGAYDPQVMRSITVSR